MRYLAEDISLHRVSVGSVVLPPDAEEEYLRTINPQEIALRREERSTAIVTSSFWVVISVEEA